MVIAAITSCTNTSNPSVLVAAGLVARKARAKGLTSKPWVKTSLAPGSQVVTDYLERERARARISTRSASTWSAMAAPPASAIRARSPSRSRKAINDNDLVAVSVLSGNRNFEGRVSPDCRANYLASPPLVVAYALKGTVRSDMVNEPIGTARNGEPVYLKDIWPTNEEIRSADRRSTSIRTCSAAATPTSTTATSAGGRSRSPAATPTRWPPASTYIQNPPYFTGMTMTPVPLERHRPVRGALAVFGDSITTDHISPAGAIKPDSPAGTLSARAPGQPRPSSTATARAAATMK